MYSVQCTTFIKYFDDIDVNMNNQQLWVPILFSWIGDPDPDPLFILFCDPFPDPNHDIIYIYSINTILIT